MKSSAKLPQGFPTTAPQAVLFDLDGTLVDSVEDIFVAVNLLLAELGFKTRTRDEITMWVGNGARMLIERAMAGRFEGFAGLDEGRARHAAADAAMPRFRAIYQEICVDHTLPLAGAHESLSYAHARGLGVAIVTNKPLAPTERIVDALGWRPFVACVIGGDSLIQMSRDGMRELGHASSTPKMRVVSIPVGGTTYTLESSEVRIPLLTELMLAHLAIDVLPEVRVRTREYDAILTRATRTWTFVKR